MPKDGRSWFVGVIFWRAGGVEGFLSGRPKRIRLKRGRGRFGWGRKPWRLPYLTSNSIALLSSPFSVLVTVISLTFFV